MTRNFGGNSRAGQRSESGLGVAAPPNQADDQPQESEHGGGPENPQRDNDGATVLTCDGVIVEAEKEQLLNG